MLRFPIDVTQIIEGFMRSKKLLRPVAQQQNDREDGEEALGDQAAIDPAPAGLSDAGTFPLRS